MNTAEETTSVKTNKQLQFEPFRAWRYDPEQVNFEDVIAPPYDVISDEKQASLYDQSNFNCIRLILNKIEANDTDTNNRYTRANQFYKEWKDQGVLTKESTPAYYLYKQEYADFSGQTKRSRFAFLGRLKLVPFEKGVVIPHEKTLAGPKKDRLKLMETTQANFSPIFGLYPKATEAMKKSIEWHSNEKPVYDVVDDSGVRHVVWPITRQSDVDAIRDGLAAQKVYIADGHHRYTTALNYSEQVRREKNVPEGEALPTDYVLTALVEFNDPGLVLEPTHRILSAIDGFNVDESLEAVKDYLDLEELPAETVCERLKAEQKLIQADASNKGKSSFGILFEDGRSFYASLKDLQKAKAKMPAGKEDLWYSLDVNLVNHLVMAGLWNIPEEKWEASLRFTHSDEGAISEIKSHKASAVFVLKAAHVSVLEEMGNIGELMPQKSTYFYPKLASGLVFYHHE